MDNHELVSKCFMVGLCGERVARELRGTVDSALRGKQVANNKYTYDMKVSYNNAQMLQLTRFSDMIAM
jgi:hypothetical protein